MKGLNAACPYYTMFPLDFPLKCLSQASENDVVLDPFCGRGTTIYAARLKRMKAYGVDSNPVAVAIAKAKLAYANVDEITNLCEYILKEYDVSVKVPEGEFWDLCFYKKNLKEICQIREYLVNSKETDTTVLLRAIMMGILHGPQLKNTKSYLSNQMPRTYATKPSSAIKYWKSRNLVPCEVDIQEIVRKKAILCLRDIPSRTKGLIMLSDSRKLKLNKRIKADWVITSPPYYGMRSYVPDQWLRYWFIGGPEEVVYSLPENIKHSSLESFTCDLTSVWNSVATYSRPNAKLIIRFGVLPSSNINAIEVMKSSLKSSSANWRIYSIKNAGKPDPYRRQANQFTDTGVSIDEIDVYARLES